MVGNSAEGSAKREARVVCSWCNQTWERCWCHECAEGRVLSRCCHGTKKVLDNRPDPT